MAVSSITPAHIPSVPPQPVALPTLQAEDPTTTHIEQVLQTSRRVVGGDWEWTFYNLLIPLVAFFKEATQARIELSLGVYYTMGYDFWKTTLEKMVPPLLIAQHVPPQMWTFCTAPPACYKLSIVVGSKEYLTEDNFKRFQYFVAYLIAVQKMGTCSDFLPDLVEEFNAIWEEPPRSNRLQELQSMTRDMKQTLTVSENCATLEIPLSEGCPLKCTWTAAPPSDPPREVCQLHIDLNEENKPLYQLCSHKGPPKWPYVPVLIDLLEQADTATARPLWGILFQLLLQSNNPSYNAQAWNLWVKKHPLSAMVPQDVIFCEQAFSITGVRETLIRDSRFLSKQLSPLLLKFGMPHAQRIGEKFLKECIDLFWSNEDTRHVAELAVFIPLISKWDLWSTLDYRYQIRFALLMTNKPAILEEGHLWRRGEGEECFRKVINVFRYDCPEGAFIFQSYCSRPFLHRSSEHQKRMHSWIKINWQLHKETLNCRQVCLLVRTLCDFDPEFGLTFYHTWEDLVGRDWQSPDWFFFHKTTSLVTTALLDRAPEQKESESLLLKLYDSYCAFLTKNDPIYLDLFKVHFSFNIFKKIKSPDDILSIPTLTLALEMLKSLWTLHQHIKFDYTTTIAGFIDALSLFLPKYIAHQPLITLVNHHLAQMTELLSIDHKQFCWQRLTSLLCQNMTSKTEQFVMTLFLNHLDNLKTALLPSFVEHFLPHLFQAIPHKDLQPLVQKLSKADLLTSLTSHLTNAPDKPTRWKHSLATARLLRHSAPENLPDLHPHALPHLLPTDDSKEVSEALQLSTHVEWVIALSNLVQSVSNTSLGVQIRKQRNALLESCVRTAIASLFNKNESEHLLLHLLGLLIDDKEVLGLLYEALGHVPKKLPAACKKKLELIRGLVQKKL